MGCGLFLAFLEDKGIGGRHLTRMYFSDYSTLSVREVVPGNPMSW